jgi:hypothetical protein
LIFTPGGRARVEVRRVAFIILGVAVFELVDGRPLRVWPAV